MVSVWWLILAVWAALILCIWMQRMAYRHGIWDGAFNHFLPHVRREMRRYDHYRAEKILRDEGLSAESPEDDLESSARVAMAPHGEKYD